MAGACAVTQPSTAMPFCEVVSGEELLHAVGGAKALCNAVEGAVAAQRLDQRFTVQVWVKPRSMFSAEVTLADGRKLPPLGMVEMDRPMVEDTLDRLGLAIAEHVVNAGAARP